MATKVLTRSVAINRLNLMIHARARINNTPNFTKMDNESLAKELQNIQWIYFGGNNNYKVVDDSPIANKLYKG